MAALGEVNSRMRDFFDVHALAEHNRMHDTWAWRPVCRRNDVIVLRWRSGTATVTPLQVRRRFPWHSFVILGTGAATPN